jgi:hypothetical protein
VSPAPGGIRAIVFDALRAAIENGFPPGEIADGSDDQIAIDLNRHCAALEAVAHEELVAHVAAWRAIEEENNQ